MGHVTVSSIALAKEEPQRRPAFREGQRILLSDRQNTLVQGFKSDRVLAFRELEAFTCSRLARLLSFLHPRITGKQTFFL